MRPIFALIICFIRPSLSAVALGQAQEHPNFPGQCYDPTTNDIKPVGDKWPMKDGCGRVMCEKWGTSLYFSYSSCPSVGAAAPCTIVSGDLRAPYPQCCPRVECPSEENEIGSNEDDQVMMASYDVTLGNEDNLQDSWEDVGFSNVFPLWRQQSGSTNIYTPK